MKLKNPLKWMLRQSLGMVLDLSLEGKPSAALVKLDGVVDSVRDVIGAAP